MVLPIHHLLHNRYINLIENLYKHPIKEPNEIEFEFHIFVFRHVVLIKEFYYCEQATNHDNRQN